MKTLLLPRAVEINVEQILYLESDSNYTYIYSKGHQKYMLVALSLCKIQESLANANFVRINRANLINTQYIKGIIREKSILRLTLINGKKFSSSRRRTEKLIDELTCLNSNQSFNIFNS